MEGELHQRGRVGVPPHLHGRDGDQDIGLRLRAQPRVLPARRLVSARFCRRHARVAAHPLPVRRQLLRAARLPRAAPAASAQAHAGHADARAVDPLGAAKDGQRAHALRLPLPHLRGRRLGALQGQAALPLRAAWLRRDGRPPGGGSAAAPAAAAAGVRHRALMQPALATRGYRL
eukprot:7264288-Prymnesium_polylepis.1